MVARFRIFVITQHMRAVNKLALACSHGQHVGIHDGTSITYKVWNSLKWDDVHSKCSESPSFGPKAVRVAFTHTRAETIHKTTFSCRNKFSYKVVYRSVAQEIYTLLLKGPKLITVLTERRNLTLSQASSFHSPLSHPISRRFFSIVSSIYA